MDWSAEACYGATPARKGVRKGRGATTNVSGRYEQWRRESFDDGWEPDEPPKLKTMLTRDHSRQVLAFNDSPDIPFDRSINPYRGCEHGCIYCFARPSHAWLGLSPGQDFETRLSYKPDAAAALARELSARNYRPATIALGANTDAYQPSERKLEITRSLVRLLVEHHHPFTIITKSALVERDMDLLSLGAEQGTVSVAVSITTLDHVLARRLEPRATAPGRRVETVKRLSEAGIPVNVLIAPIIPGLNDEELEAVMAKVASAGARDIHYILLRLPREIKDLFGEWLEVHYPLKANRVWSLIRQTRDGHAYQSQFGLRMRGSGPIADLIARRFAGTKKRLDLPGMPGLSCDRFVPPSEREPGGGRQLGFDL